MFENWGYSKFRTISIKLFFELERRAQVNVLLAPVSAQLSSLLIFTKTNFNFFQKLSNIFKYFLKLKLGYKLAIGILSRPRV